MKEHLKDNTSLQLNDFTLEYERVLHELKSAQIANEKLKNSYSYRLGNALIKSKSSLRNFIQLPKKLFNIRKEMIIQNEKIKLKELPTQIHKIGLPIVNFCTLGLNPLILDKNVRWYEFEIDSLKTFKILHRLFVENVEDIQNHEQVVMRVEIYGQDDKVITSKEHNLFHSKAVGFYRYIDSRKLYSEFTVSKQAKKIRIGFQCWKNKGNIFIDENIFLFDKINWFEKASSITSYNISNQPIKRYEHLKIACILDELTYECLQHEITTVKLMPQSWKTELSRSKPDFLLVESCWKGNDNAWGTLTRGSGGSRKLADLLAYCKANNIPTVFWNKEDPVHYDKFSAIGALFEHVFTSDVNMVKKYKEDFNIDVAVLPFAAQPKIHNPSVLKNIKRQNKAVFAGSYYVEKTERCHDFNNIMDILSSAKLEVDIFDRCLNLDDPRLKFPEQYKKNIKGHLKPEELSIVNSGYLFQINMNSVQHSSTMFARRVFESLAAGTPVIGNYSQGVKELFGDIVIDTTDKNKALSRIKELKDNFQLYNELSKQGVREVMRHHTYYHRVKSICDKIGLNVSYNKRKLTMVVFANNKNDYNHSLLSFKKQTLENKKLLIILDKFEGYTELLIPKIKNVECTMNFSKDFYSNKDDYIGSDFYVEIENLENITDTFLEDYYYSNCWATQ